MFYPHIQNVNVITILGGLYFLIFRGEISDEEGHVYVNRVPGRVEERGLK